MAEHSASISTVWYSLCSGAIELTAFDHEEVPAAFQKLISIWRDRPHTVNRRLAGAMRDLEPELKTKVWKSARKLYRDLMPSVDETVGVEIRRLISKTDLFSSHCYEVSLFETELCHSFFPVSLEEEHPRNPHVTIPYRIRIGFEEHDSLILALETASESDNAMTEWLKRTVHPALLRWLKNMRLDHEAIDSIRLVDLERYADTYRRIKETHGKALAESWPERTNAEKFVFEDCAIAAYLVELWGDERQTFVDIGCGNGLLVYLLHLERHKGIGLDVRKRNIWDKFGLDCELREMSIDPSSSGLSGIPRQDWLIGNHSDELTPWIPIMAAKSASNFFLLPCCPFDFYGKFTKGRKSIDGTTHFPSYLDYVRWICNYLGFDVQEDRLKIPSTKRACFIGTIPKYGLPADVSKRIALLTSITDATPNFVARPKAELVRNCSQLPFDFRHALTLKLFNILLETESDSIASDLESGTTDGKPESGGITVSVGSTNIDLESKQSALHEENPATDPESRTNIPESGTNSTTDAVNKPWRKGGRISLADCATHLSDYEKHLLKAQCGGLQTFLRNQHQVFCVDAATVSIRDWENFGRTKSGEKRTPCWFYAHHPQKCPLTTEKCTYLHTKAL